MASFYEMDTPEFLFIVTIIFLTIFVLLLDQYERRRAKRLLAQARLKAGLSQANTVRVEPSLGLSANDSDMVSNRHDTPS